MSIFNITDPYSRVRYFLALVQFQNRSMIHLCYPDQSGSSEMTLDHTHTLELNRVMGRYILSTSKDKDRGYILQPGVEYNLAMSYSIGNAKLAISVNEEGILSIDDDSAMKIFGKSLSLLNNVVTQCNDREKVNMVEIEFIKSSNSGAHKLAVNSGHLKQGPLAHQFSLNIAGTEHFFWTKTLDKITALNERGLPVHLFRQAKISIPDVDLDAAWFNDELQTDEIDRRAWMLSVASELNNNFSLSQGFHVMDEDLIVPGLDQNPKNFVALVTEENDLIIKVKQGEHSFLLPSGLDTVIVHDLRDPSKNITVSDRINGVFSIVNNTL